MDDHDLVLKPMVTLGTLILGNLHIHIYTHTRLNIQKKQNDISHYFGMHISSYILMLSPYLIDPSISSY